MSNIKNLAEEAVNLYKTGQINVAKKKYLDVLKIMIKVTIFLYCSIYC